MKNKIDELDDIDRKIIFKLQEDGKASSKDIAEELKVSDGTVRFRMNKLINRGLLKITASINPFCFKNGIAAVVGMELEKRTHARTMKSISNLDGVVSVCNVSGKYDLLVEVFLESRNDLNKFLIEDLSRIEGINRTETFIILDAMDKWMKLPETPLPVRLVLEE